MEIQLRCWLSVTGGNRYGTAGAHRALRGTPSLMKRLVDPINDARSEVDRCQAPMLQVILRVGDLSEAKTEMVIQVEVDTTRDRPLRAEIFDWLYVANSHNWRI